MNALGKIMGKFRENVVFFPFIFSKWANYFGKKSTISLDFSQYVDSQNQSSDEQSIFK